jgi:beta-galactosidase GanA
MPGIRYVLANPTTQASPSPAPQGRRRRGTLLATVLLAAGLAVAASPSQPAQAAPPAQAAQAAPHTVSYDRYSLIVDGQRLFLWSAEFHYWRLPSPDLWRDVLQKMKAAGFNAVSIYFSWGYHSPAPGVYDFTGVRDVDRLLDIAAEVGIYVIARPGPYINAETDAGGFPAWLVTQSGQARTTAPDYLAAAKDWLHRVDASIARHQYTSGTGTVLLYQIENELYDATRTAYMQALIDQVRADGITVPTTGNHHNAFATGIGATDLPGWDLYPQGFNCGNPTTWRGLPTYTRPRPDRPLAVWEYGSGSFDPWGGYGYDNCRQLTNEQYENVFYKNFIGQGGTAVNFYMTYGGTSWGWLYDPDKVYSSYDYGAPIDEARRLGAKYDQMKRLGYLVNTVKPLAKTDVGSLASGPSNTAIRADVRVNPDTRTQFVVLRHATVDSTTDDTTTIGISTPDGAYPRVPQQGSIRLAGRDSKLYVANYALGAAHLVYSTSEILTHAAIGGRDVAVLYGRGGHGGETVLRYAGQPTVTVQSGTATATWDATRGDLRLNYDHTAGARVLISGGGATRPLELILTSDAGAAQFWRHDTAAGPVLVRGPQLVRTAAVNAGTVALSGDTAATAGLEVWADGAAVVTWNGAPVAVSPTPAGSLAGTVGGPQPVTLPALAWRYRADTAESGLGFDDSSWVRALHGLTVDGYGYHHGNVWYRGHFTGVGTETQVSLTALTGVSGVYAAWLNGTYLGSGTGGDSATTTTFTIPAGLVRTGRDNVLAVLVDNTGHNEDFRADDNHKEPRGLTAASITGATDTIGWRIQGARGGQTPIDPVRGPMNTGGLGGERAGWSLPGFPDSGWSTVALPHTAGAPGVGWYRSTVTLNLPAGQDSPVALSITDNPSRRYSALLFVNGWQLGRYVNNVGPQHVFPIPEGILNPRGSNTIAIAVWSRDGATAGLGTVRLTSLGTYAGGPSVGAVTSPGYDPFRYGAPDVTAPTGSVHVSDLPFLAVPQNGWGPVERDRSVGESQPGDGRTLTLRGATYAKGLGTHASSDVSVYAGGRCTSFTATVGVDDETAGAGSVTFAVFADGIQVARTGTLTGTSPPQAITADVTGARQVDLVVGDAGDGTGRDHADWADARLACGATPSNRYEAENATISQGVVESNWPGFSGTGFVNYDNLVGSYVQWTVNAASAGPATLRIRHANGSTANRPMDITVDGTLAADDLAFPPTGAWSTWQTVTATVTLNVGANTIRATATTASGGPNIDYLEVA